MAHSNLQRWEREFRKAAKADELDLLGDHLCKLELSEDPELLLEGTINLIYACAAYAVLDNQSFGAFLKMQRYDPADSPEAIYAFTFDLCAKAFGRVLFSKKVGILDLADLYNHPWDDYKVVGYHSIHISRIDGKDLSSKELAQLEKEVTYDLRFDYAEDELELWFDDESIDGALVVRVQDREEL